MRRARLSQACSIPRGSHHAGTRAYKEAVGGTGTAQTRTEGNTGEVRGRWPERPPPFPCSTASQGFGYPWTTWIWQVGFPMRRPLNRGNSMRRSARAGVLINGLGVPAERDWPVESVVAKCPQHLYVPGLPAKHERRRLAVGKLGRGTAGIREDDLIGLPYATL